jgi:hypothetical protein
VGDGGLVGALISLKGMPPAIELLIVQIAIKKLFVLQGGQLFLRICALLDVSLFRIDVVLVIVIVPLGHLGHTLRFLDPEGVLELTHKL